MKINQRILIVFLLLAIASCSTPEPTENVRFGPVEFSGGNGKNYKKAIVIENATNMGQGMKAIGHYLSKTYGKQGLDWVMFGKGHKNAEGKDYYLYEIALRGEKKTKVIYFDVTGFWGKY